MRKLIAAVGLALTMASRADAQQCTNVTAIEWLTRGWCKLGNVDLRMNSALHLLSVHNPLITISTGPGYFELTMSGLRQDGVNSTTGWVHSLFTWEVASQFHVAGLEMTQFDGGILPMGPGAGYQYDSAVIDAGVYDVLDLQPGPIVRPPTGYSNQFVTYMRSEQGLDNTNGVQYATTNWIDSATFRITMGPGTPVITPEPSTWALILAAGAAVFFMRRRTVPSAMRTEKSNT